MVKRKKPKNTRRIRNLQAASVAKSRTGKERILGDNNIDSTICSNITMETTIHNVSRGYEHCGSNDWES